MGAWLAAYGKAWETQDPDAAVALFTPEATYQEKPFDEPMRGREAIREYWATGAGHQREVRFDSRILSVEPAVGHWWASYTATATGELTKLDGIFLLEFDDEGLCTSLREWWHATPRPSF
ncbi:MAG: nuclear transport factor 2 family protein [Actinomycetota bacterium]